MKKLKVLRGALIGVFVVAAACCIFTACSSDKDSSDDTPITEMTLSIDNVKRTYLTYQSFSTAGLEAEVKRESGNKETISASYLDVDHSDFDNTKAGEYDIVVSYTEDDVTLTQSYGVEVIEEITGMKVEKTTVDYAITGEAGAEIKLDDMTVYSVTGENETTRKLSSGEYELKYFKGGEEITSLSGLSAGVYTIYAYREVEISGKYSNIDYECGAYVLVYVSDSLVSLTFNEEGAVVTQDLSSEDIMTGTWTFKLVYESGITKILSVDDVVVTNLNTARPATGGETAVVTYTEKYYVSDDTRRVDTSVTTNVRYTITIPDGGVTLEYAFDFDALIKMAGFQEYAEIVDQTALEASWFTGDNAFISFDPGSGSNYIRTGSDGCIEIKNAKMTISFYGSGYIEIGFTGTGSGASSLALQDASGNYIQGMADTENDSGYTEYAFTSGGTTQYVYVVTGTSIMRSVRYDITAPGTYSIVANVKYYDNDASTDSENYPNRGTRVKSIVMIDNVEDAGSTQNTNALSVTSLGDLDLSMPEETNYTCGDASDVRGKKD